MAREIVFDTETTGLNPLGGDRIVEIGCVEIDNSISTGRVFHAYMNPERDMPEGAFRVHGLSTEFLADKPLFSAIAEDLLNFIGDSRLIAHNASFDMGFLNAELTRSGHVAIGQERVVDTLVIARRKHPYASNSLDALCQRYNIDTSRRIKHGDEFSGNAQKRPTELQSRLTKSEQEAHAAFIAELGKDSVWLKYHKAVSSEA